jgi:hypothetical protein
LGKYVTISHTKMYRDNVIGASYLHPTYSVITTNMGNKRMVRHLGTETSPPLALRHSYIAFYQVFRGRQYEGCGNDWLTKYKYAAANFAECCAWAVG